LSAGERIRFLAGDSAR
jgi:hypothetical protein